MDGLPKKLAKAGVKVGSMDCDDQVQPPTNSCYQNYFLYGFYAMLFFCDNRPT